MSSPLLIDMSKPSSLLETFGAECDRDHYSISHHGGTCPECGKSFPNPNGAPPVHPRLRGGRGSLERWYVVDPETTRARAVTLNGPVPEGAIDAGFDFSQADALARAHRNRASKRGRPDAQSDVVGRSYTHDAGFEDDPKDVSIDEAFSLPTMLETFVIDESLHGSKEELLAAFNTLYDDAVAGDLTAQDALRDIVDELSRRAETAPHRSARDSYRGLKKDRGSKANTLGGGSPSDWEMGVSDAGGGFSAGGGRGSGY